MRTVSEPRAQRRFVIVGRVDPALLFLASCYGSSKNAPLAATPVSTEPSLLPAPEAPTPGWVWVSEPGLGFTASVPAHWKRESMQGSGALKTSPSWRMTTLSYRPSSILNKSQAVSIHVDVSFNPALIQVSGLQFLTLAMQLDKVGPFVTTVEELRKQDRKVLVPLQVTRIGPYPAAWSVADFTPPGSVTRLRVFAMYASTNSAFYIVGVTGYAEYGEAAGQVFKRLRDSIRLTESIGASVELPPNSVY